MKHIVQQIHFVGIGGAGIAGIGFARQDYSPPFVGIGDAYPVVGVSYFGFVEAVGGVGSAIGC